MLPAANQSLRDYITYGRRYNDPRAPLTTQVSSTVLRILEQEVRYANQVKAAKMDLFKHSEYQRHKAFHEISRGLTYINMSDLIYFCEYNGFYPRTDDLEAILRRCDHDADRCLTFEEFCEITELNLNDQNDGEGQSINHDAAQNNNSPSKKEIQQAVEKSQPLKKSSSNDRLDANPKEDMEQSWNRKEAERREKEWRDEVERREREWKENQQRKYDGGAKLVQFITDKIPEYVNIDFQKKILGYHGSYDCLTFFRELDADNKGHVTAEDFAKHFEGNDDFTDFDFANLVSHIGHREEGKVSFVELQDALTSHCERGAR